MLSPLPRSHVRASRHAALFFIYLALVFFAYWMAVTKSQNQATGRDSTAPVQTSESKPRLSTDYGNLPLQFEVNEGQAPDDVKFISRGSGYNLHLKSGEALFSLRKSEAETSTLRIRMVGSGPAEQISARDELPGRMNYFVGNDRTQWRTGIKTYKEVEYKNVYPGVDLVYYGNQGKLEYDFVVAPGVDPRSIQVAFNGANAIRLDETGALIVKIDDAELRQPAPFVYQEIGNERKQVEGRYVLTGPDTFAFEVGEYDHSEPLVIDPTLTYSTFLQTSSADGLFVDGAGNAYITGTTQGDVFVFKLNSSGTALTYSTIIGGNFSDTGVGIVVDTAGDVYVTGRTQSSDFPTVNAVQTTLGGSFGDQDAFVAKINPTGSGLIYSTYLGGSGFDFSRGIVVTANGSACVAGGTSSTNFPTANALQAAKNPSFGSDAFATKLSPSGSTFVYSTYLGGSGDDAALTLALDAADNTYIAGRTDSTNFPSTVNAKQPGLGGDTDGFISKLNPAGSQLLYSSYHGGSGYDAVLDMVLDSVGNIYVTGETGSADFPVLSAAQPMLSGFHDVFITKLNPTGNSFVYSTYLGGTSSDTPWALAIDSTGSAYVTGHTQSGDFPLVDAIQRVLADPGDAFITKLNPAGTAVIFSTLLGGSAADIGQDIAVNSAGSIFVIGSTSGGNFPTTPNVLHETSEFFSVGFAIRIDSGSANYYQISGKVTGVPFSIPIALTGSTSRTVDTDSNGRYSFQVLAEGGTYTITPTAPAGYNLTPSSRTYAALNADHTDADFVVPPPANDNFANAQVITDISAAVNGTNTGATVEPGETTDGNASVWYRWQAPATAGVVLNQTAGPGGTFIGVFTGASVGSLTRVSNNMNSCTFFGGCNSLGTSFKANAGTVYFIRVANSTTATGDFSFSFATGITISGRVKNINGRALDGASVRVRRLDTDVVTSTVSTSDGYSIVVLPGFSYDVLPSLPPVNSFGSVIFNNLTADVGNVDFFATSPTITISGFLFNLTSGDGISVTATGTGISSKGCEVINVSGTITYKCSSLSVFGDYTIVPSSTNHTFTPPDKFLQGAGGDTGVSFTANQVQLPAATTSAATNITLSAATLNGSINPNGLATNAWFEWGTSDTLATNNSTAQQAIGAGTSAVSVSANLTNLSAGTTYFYRAVGMSSSGTTRGSISSFTTPVQVTVQTNPLGRSFSVDGGAPVTATQVLEWIPGSSHTITTTSPQAVTPDSQFVWSGWSDNGAISHTVTTPSVNTTYTANFNTQYMLTMTAGAGGTVTPSSGFFNSGQSVQITATPNSGFNFIGWTGTGTGSFTGNTNTASVTMNGPVTQTASFQSATALLLMLDTAGPVPDQVIALDATTLLRDPFPVTSPFTWFYTSDRNTRLTIFLQNFQPSNEPPSAVVVNLVGSNNQSFDVPAEDVRPVANSNLTQVTFRLPNELPIGTCAIKVKAQGVTTNSGTLTIKL